MIVPHWYIMYCFNCGKDEPVSHEIEADKVIVTIDLVRDQYVFEAYCPGCGEDIINTRSAFGR